jgi:PleD family two-component response regulator
MTNHSFLRDSSQFTPLDREPGMAHARKKVLCVEDDRETATLIAEELVERGFEVRIAHNGQEGLLAILEDKPDLVLCDISMPIMSGFRDRNQKVCFTSQAACRNRIARDARFWNLHHSTR